MKKIIVIGLTLIMVIAMMPLTAMAATTVNSATELTAALATGGDIVLGTDIDAGDLVQGTFFTVAGGNTVALDLNGHTLQGTRIDGTITSGNRNTAIITNYGSLTIQDNAGGGQIMIDTTIEDSWNSCTAAVSNIGTLNVQSGTLLNNGGTSMAYAVDNLSGSGSPVLNVSGGLLKSVNYIAIRQFTNSVTMTNTVNITGGMVYGYKRGIWIQQPSASNGLGTLNISGGMVEATLQAAVQVDLLGTDGIDIYITGGTLINDCDTRATLALTLDTVPTAGGGYVYINGGTFTNTGTAGNIGDETVGGTAVPSVIEVYAGTFSTTVPNEFIPEDADPSNIVVVNGTDVEAGVDVTYTIIIPASVDFGTLTAGAEIVSQPFNVTATGVLLEGGAHVDIAVSSDFTMSDGGADLPYELYNVSSGGIALSSGNQFASFDEDGTQDGRAEVDTSDITNAGSFMDTMVFTITYVG